MDDYEGAVKMIKRLSWRGTLILSGCLGIPALFVGQLVRNKFGMVGNLALATLIVLVGVPWAYRSSGDKTQ